MCNSKSTKEKIIEAAYDCFSKKGYVATSTKEIANKAGVSEITLFRHFGTKDGIFEAVIRNYSILSDLKKLSIEIDKYDLEEILIFVGKRMYDTLLKKKRFIRILFSEINKYPDTLSNIYDKFIRDIDKLLINILLEKQGSYPLKTLDMNIVVKAFMGMIFSYFQTNEVFLNRSVPDEELNLALNTFVKIFLEGIRAN